MSAGKEVRLDVACNVEYGTRVVRKRDGGNLYPVYGGGGATFKLDDFNREDRLVIARFGMSEECTRFVAGKFFLNDSGLTVSPRNGEMSQRFLDYQLLSKNDYIFSLGKGSAQKNLDVPAFRELSLFVPIDIAEQHRIVGILDETFKGIVAAKANAEKNLQNSRAIYDSSLQLALSQGGAGWIEATLGDVLEVLRNGLNCKQDKSGRGTKVSRIESIWNAEFDVTRVGYADMPESHKAKFLLQKNDVLFSHINSATHIGKTAVFCEDEEVVHGVNLLLMRPKAGLLAAFLDLYMKYIFARGYWLPICKQSINQASVNQQDINPVPIRFPNLKLQRVVVDRMADLRQETRRLESIYQRKVIALDALKESLLHQAFSGQL